MILYELAYRLHTDVIINHQQQNDENLHSQYINDETLASLRLTIIVSNNLGEINRITGNQVKHRMCLEHLVSVIMYTIHNKVVGNVLNKTEFDGILRNVSPIVLDNVCSSVA